MAATPMRRRRAIQIDIPAKIRTGLRAIGRAFNWYVDNFLDFAPLLDVLGHTSLNGMMHIARRGTSAARSPDVEYGQDETPTQLLRERSVSVRTK